MNALLVAALPILAYTFAAQGLEALRGQRVLPVPRLTARAGWTIFALVLAFWIVRNIPLFPFTLLAPH